MKLTVEQAFRKYGDRVFTAAFHVCRNREDADDVVQDTFLKYHAMQMDYESEEHIKAWLLRTAINRSKDLLKSFWRIHMTPWEDYMNELEFAEPQDKGLFEAVMHLPRKYRIVVPLFYYEEYSVEQIAGILRIPTGTVKSQLSRARMLLKNELMEEWNDDE